MCRGKCSFFLVGAAVSTSAGAFPFSFSPSFSSLNWLFPEVQLNVAIPLPTSILRSLPAQPRVRNRAWVMDEYDRRRVLKRFSPFFACWCPRASFPRFVLFPLCYAEGGEYLTCHSSSNPLPCTPIDSAESGKYYSETLSRFFKLGISWPSTKRMDKFE